jgi:P4 family phage/plasmid primase-like protien
MNKADNDDLGRSFNDIIAAVEDLALLLDASEPDEPKAKGSLNDPRAIEDQARVRAATRNMSGEIPAHRRATLKAVDDHIGEAVIRFLPPKAVKTHNAKIEARIRGLWREDKHEKRDRRQELLDAPLANAFIADNEIFRQQGGDVHLWDGERWRGSEALGPALDRYRHDLAGDDREARSELLSSKKLSALVRGVEMSGRLAILDLEFDAKRDLLGLPGGRVCELRTGIIRPLRACDYVRMRTAIFPGKGATPKWDQFKRETFCGDKELIAAATRLLGYALTGETGLRKAFIFDGHGRNGKSTLCRVLRAILGDYGYASSARIVASGYSGHDTIFAALHNKRLVEIPETDHTLVLGERFKILTGNDTIAGRGMRENERAIPIHGKLMISANNNIKFDATSKSFADRICVVPFKHMVAKPNPALFDELMTEAPAILAALIDEAKAFYGEPGLLSCAAISEATEIYLGQADRYAAWFEETYQWFDPNELDQSKPGFCAKDMRERLIEAAGQDTIPDDCLGYPLKVVFDNWRTFAIAEGDYVGNSKLLASALRERGILVKLQRTSRTNYVVGIRLRA